MKEKVTIESVNKISQIYSVDVHCNPLICDVRLDVEQTVSGQSEIMKDIHSAKANAYAKAKGEFKLNVGDILNEQSVFYFDRNSNKKFTAGIDDAITRSKFGRNVSISFSHSL